MKPKILIVDNDDRFRNPLRGWLRDAFPFCELLEAKSGEAALALSSVEKPDIILMEIRLPAMDGIEATREIKKALPATKVVILTIFKDKNYREKAALAGVSAYVPKQQMLEELIPVLKSLLPEIEKENKDLN